MVELVVISGKGGTGKTSILGAFAALGTQKVLCDADVDAADLHLLLSPRIEQREEFWAGYKAFIDPGACVQCGECRKRCRFEAISEEFVVDEFLCEGCGVCAHFCPEKAADMMPNLCGEWFVSDTRLGPLVHARLGIAEENSGKLVSLVRKQARRVAEEKGLDLILTDGPPGIGCPVIAAIGGATAVLIVSEPTVSGSHDLERAAGLAQSFHVPVLVCVNKADLHPHSADSIERWCRDQGHYFVGRLPFDSVFTQAQLEGKTVPEMGNGPGKAAVIELWDRVHPFLRANSRAPSHLAPSQSAS